MKKVIIVFILGVLLISCNDSSVKPDTQGGTYDDTDTLQPILDSVAHAQDSILESTDIGGFKK